MRNSSDPLAAKEIYRRPMRFAMALFILLSIFRLGLIAARPLAFLGGAADDDRLFVEHARSIERGDWLGPYNELTLVKGPGFPILIAGLRWLGVEYGFGTQLMWCGSCLLLLAGLERMARGHVQFWILFAVAGVILFHPSSWSGSGRVAPEVPLYMSQTVAILAGGLLIVYAGKRRARFWWGVFTGLLLGWFWVTREEGLWLVPSMAILIAWIFWADWRAGSGTTAGDQARTKSKFIWAASMAATPVLVACLVNYTICTINYVNYKIFCVVELKQPDFLAAYGALARIDPAHRLNCVPVSLQAQKMAYRVSPTFRRLRPFLEGAVGKAWSFCSEAYLPLAYKGEIGGGHFMWALREAVFDASNPKDGAEAMQMYHNIAMEINTAINAGQIPAGPRRDTLAPPVRWSDWRPLAHSAKMGLDALIKVNLLGLKSALSGGTPSQLYLFSDMLLNSATPTEQGSEVMMNGWAFDVAGKPIDMRLVPTGSSSTPLPNVEWRDSPDIAAGVPQAKGIATANKARFHLDGWANAQNKLVFSVDHKDIASLDYEHGQRYLGGPQIFANIESAIFSDQFGRRDRPDQITPAHHLFDIRQAQLIEYQKVQPYFFAAGVVAFLATIAAAARRRPGAVAFGIMAIIVLGAIFMRVALLAYIDALSFPAINGLYLAPAYPLIPLFAGLSICGATCWFAITKKQYPPLQHVGSYPSDDSSLTSTTALPGADHAAIVQAGNLK